MTSTRRRPPTPPRGGGSDEGDAYQPPRRGRGELRMLQAYRHALHSGSALVPPGRSGPPRRRPIAIQARGLYGERAVIALVVSRGWTRADRFA